MSCEVGGSANLAKRTAIASAGFTAWDAATTTTRIRESRSICGIERLSAELQVETFREFEGSEYRRVQVEQVWTVEDVLSRVAKALSVNAREAIRIEPVLPVAHRLRGTDGAARAVRILVVAGGIERTAAGAHSHRSV